MYTISLIIAVIPFTTLVDFTKFFLIIILHPIQRFICGLILLNKVSFKSSEPSFGIVSLVINVNGRLFSFENSLILKLFLSSTSKLLLNRCKPFLSKFANLALLILGLL